MSYFPRLGKKFQYSYSIVMKAIGHVCCSCNLYETILSWKASATLLTEKTREQFKNSSIGFSVQLYIKLVQIKIKVTKGSSADDLTIHAPNENYDTKITQIMATRSENGEDCFGKLEEHIN